MKRKGKRFRLLVAVFVILASSIVSLADNDCTFCLAAGLAPADAGKAAPFSATYTGVMDSSRGGETSPIHPEGGPCVVCAHVAAVSSQPLPSPVIASLSLARISMVNVPQEVIWPLFRPPKGFC